MHREVLLADGVQRRDQGNDQRGVADGEQAAARAIAARRRGAAAKSGGSRRRTPARSPSSGISSSGSVWNSKSVEGDVQRQPDNVHEVPVQHRPLDAEVAARREVAHERPNEHADQHQHADRDVQAVQPGQAEEDAAVDARGDRRSPR